MTTLRYFLDPSAPDGLRAEPLAVDRCAYWWSLYNRRESARLALAACDDVHHQPALAEALADANYNLRIHYEICLICHDWFAELSVFHPCNPC